MLRRRAILLVLLSLGVSVAGVAVAQDEGPTLPLGPERGAEATPDESLAFDLALEGQYIRARNLAKTVLRTNAHSYVAHYVLGLVNSYAEADFPRAQFELDLALRDFVAQHGDHPEDGTPWKWHSRILRALADVHNNLEHYAQRLHYIEQYNARYRPHIAADRAWSLMKMGDYRAARAAAEEASTSSDPRERIIALTSLCAIEFEAGNDGASYDICRRALENARNEGDNIVVELANFGEASRSLFKLREAEETILEATTAGVSANGDPWMDLAELYTREGRHFDAYHALKQIPAYRMQRPPEYRDADRNETRRALAAFLLVIGRPYDAVRITEKALNTPDRRAHQSRDPVQDRTIIALLDRQAHLILAELEMEKASGEPWWKWPIAYAEASYTRLTAWRSGRRAAALLSDDEHLTGVFRIGTSHSAVMPPWLVGDLIHVVGAGVAEEAITRARRRDQRPGARAYYDAFTAEAAFVGGDAERAITFAGRALGTLPPEEVLLRARTAAIQAECFMREGNPDAAALMYHQVFESDPGVFRRLGLRIPIRLGGGPVDEFDLSPRFVVRDDAPYRLDVEAATERGMRVARVSDLHGAVLGRGVASTSGSRGSGSQAEQARRRALDDVLFAPRIDLSQSDVTSLDGSNRVGREPLQDLVDVTGLDSQTP